MMMAMAAHRVLCFDGYATTERNEANYSHKRHGKMKLLLDHKVIVARIFHSISFYVMLKGRHLVVFSCGLHMIHNGILCD